MQATQGVNASAFLSNQSAVVPGTNTATAPGINTGGSPMGTQAYGANGGTTGGSVGGATAGGLAGANNSPGLSFLKSTAQMMGAAAAAAAGSVNAVATAVANWVTCNGNQCTSQHTYGSELDYMYADGTPVAHMASKTRELDENTKEAVKEQAPKINETKEHLFAESPSGMKYTTSDGTQVELTYGDVARLRRIQENESSILSMGINGFGFTGFVDTTSDFDEDMLEISRKQQSNRELRTTNDLNGWKKKRFDESMRHKRTEGVQVLQTAMAASDLIGVGSLVKRAALLPVKIVTNEVKGALKEAAARNIAKRAENQCISSSTSLIVYDPVYAAKQSLNNGRIRIDDLMRMVPEGTPDTFKPSLTIDDGSKFNFTTNGRKIEVKLHSPDLNAGLLFPGSNSGAHWTTQIKIGNKYFGSDGLLHGKVSDSTHIPVDFFDFDFLNPDF